MSKYYCLILIFSLASCYQPTRNGSEYKTGSFTFDYVVEGETKTGRFTRDDKYSVEYYENKVDSSTVRWINDCEFVLKSIDEQTSIHFKILETTEKNYTFEYRNAIRNPKKKLIVKKGTATKTN